MAGKVTAGLTESDGSLPPGGWLIVICGLTACTLGSAPGRPGSTLSNEYGKSKGHYLLMLLLGQSNCQIAFYTNGANTKQTMTAFISRSISHGRWTSRSRCLRRHGTVMPTMPLNRPVITLHQFPQCFAEVDKARHKYFATYTLQHSTKTKTHSHSSTTTATQHEGEDTFSQFNNQNDSYYN